MNGSIFSDISIRRRLSQDGFAVIPFADQKMLADLKELYTSLEHLPSRGTHVTMFNPSYEYRKAVDKGIKQLAGKRAEQLMEGYRVLYTNFMVKEPGIEGDFPVHQDWTYVDESKHASYALWIPLQDVNEHNGALHMVKGSHRFLTALRGPHVHEPFRQVSQVIRDDWSEVVRLRAGEALVWDHRMIHFSEPNIGDAPRLVLTLIMVPEHCPVIHCFGTPESHGTLIEKMEVDTDFFMRYTIGSKPDFVPVTETIEQAAVDFDADMLKQSARQSSMNKDYTDQSEKVARYYDEWQAGYDQVYGDMIQAFRPADHEDLMNYISSSARIMDGQAILDAGCGVAGPARWIARKYDVTIDAVTISQIQAGQAMAAIDREKLSSRVRVYAADYHELSENFEPDHFDLVLFLESLGHSGEPAVAIAEAYTVLKPGGSIYIKDFYLKEPADPVQKARVSKTIANIDRFYQYNTLNLPQTIIALRSVGFEIDYIRKFNFADDISIRQAFETRFNIDIFGGEEEFAPAEWLEIKCTKPRI